MGDSTLTPLFAGRMRWMGTQKKGHHSIQSETNPKIHDQPKIDPFPLMLGSQGQVRHDEEVNDIPQYNRHQRRKEVLRKTHSLPLDTRSYAAGFHLGVLLSSS